MSATDQETPPLELLLRTDNRDLLTVAMWPYQGLADYWILRIIVQFRLYFSVTHLADAETVMARLGFPDPQSYADNPVALFHELTRKLEAANRLPRPTCCGPLTENVQWLGDELGLNEVERNVVTFIVLLGCDDVLADVLDLLGGIGPSRIERIIATTLGFPIEQVTKAMSVDCLLMSAGLVSVHDTDNYRVRHKISLNLGLQETLMRSFEDRSEILKAFFWRAPTPALEASDFEHIQREYHYLREYLTRAKADGTKGVNILIYGPAGTGKTMLARTMCREIGAQLLEVASESTDRKPLNRDDRFAAYQFTQCFLSKGPTAFVLFDEMEDLFPSEIFVKEKLYKSWFNRLLESNPIPAFWITNDVSRMDNAYLRRFDFVLELGIPGQAVRKKILRNYFGENAVSEPWLAHISQYNDLAPAHTERIARVAKVIAQDSATETEAVAECMLTALMRATGGAAIEARNSKQRALPYDLSLVNADHDLAAVIAGLARDGGGRICLFGPPGTGKTAFGHHLAAELARPIHNIPASKLLSKCVGDTEKNIARLFNQAQRDQAVILLDEADSFLQARTGAQHSWEVTLVNELLVQLEKFDGVLVASTNLLASVDSAAMRRFDFKIRFDDLNAIQRATLFMDSLRLLGFPAVDTVAPAVLTALARLTTLTPGDFAACLRRLRLLGDAASPEALLDALKVECRHKPGALAGPMGFMH